MDGEVCAICFADIFRCTCSRTGGLATTLAAATIAPARTLRRTSSTAVAPPIPIAATALRRDEDMLWTGPLGTQVFQMNQGDEAEDHTGLSQSVGQIAMGAEDHTWLSQSVAQLFPQ